MAKEIKVNLEAVKSALINSKNLFDADIRGVEIVDPKKLTIDSRFYGIEVTPLTKKEDQELLPFTSNYVAGREIVVSSIASLDNDTVTVNGTIDLKKNPTGVVKVKDLYFTNQEDVKEVCTAITEIYVDRLMKIQDIVKKEVAALMNQLEEKKF